MTFPEVIDEAIPSALKYFVPSSPLLINAFAVTLPVTVIPAPTASPSLILKLRLLGDTILAEPLPSKLLNSNLFTLTVSSTLTGP